MNWIRRFLTAIATHKADVSAHHAKYTDAEALLALYGYGGIYWQTFFESADGLETDIVGAGQVQCQEDVLKLLTGGIINDYTLAYRMCYLPIGGDATWDKLRRIKTRFEIPVSVANCEAWLVSGDGGEYGATLRHIGFKVINGTLSGTVGDNVAESVLVLQTITTTDKPVVEAVLTPGVECRFFVNGVDKGVITTNLPSGEAGASVLMELSLKTTIAAIRYLSLSEWHFLQQP